MYVLEGVMDVSTLVEELRGLRGDVRQLREDMERYRGFVAGAAWCFATIGGGVGFVWGLLFN